MATITLNGITGNSPYNITVCDGFGNNCVNFPSVPGVTPINLTLPALYDSAPITMVTILDSSGCSRMELFYCDDVYPENVCFNFRVTASTTSWVDYPVSLTIDENINNVPSYVGTFFTTPILMYWTGTNWLLTPFGFTASGPDLYFGIWGELFSYIGSLSNSYCPSICVFTDDGVSQNTVALQYTLGVNTPPGTDFTVYQDIFSDFYVVWNSGSTVWEYYEFSVLQATLSGSENVTPIGLWIIESGSSYTNIVTSLVCPSIISNSKQFQNGDYFFFMNTEVYDFQN